MAYLDVDHIPELMRASRLAGYNRWNWASFNEADHFGDARRPLRQRLAEDAAKHGHELPNGQIFLLTHLRYLGYNFNPVSFFYCHDADGRLQHIMSEVKNTFGDASQEYQSCLNNQRSGGGFRTGGGAFGGFSSGGGHK